MHPHQPPTGTATQPFGAVPALGHPLTQAALARDRRRHGPLKVAGVVLSVAGAVALVVAIASGQIGEGADGPTGDGAGTLARWLGPMTLLGIVLVAIGVALVWASWWEGRTVRRMEWLLGHYPWVARERYHLHEKLAARYLTLSVIIEADAVGPASRSRIDGGRALAALSHYSGGPILVAGDPLREAVITTPDMQSVARIVPYRGPLT